MSVQAHTIVALASASGIAGVAVVRLSGSEAVAIASALCASTDMPHGQMQLRTLREPLTNAPIDTGYVVYFGAPRSYTGEDIVEFHVHGSPAGVDRLIAACCAGGARIADRGEFTQRALGNGKLDLAQAEGLLDVLHAQAEHQHNAALAHLDGRLSRAIDLLRQPLLRVTAEIEARIDFAAEPHLAHFDRGPIRALLLDIAERTQALAATAQAGRVRLRGARVVLAGAPNAGKSTLLNALVGHDRAIVDPRPGTTRDTLEVATAPEGVLVTWIDTAGLRLATDSVEAQGTARALGEVEHADLVLWIIDQGAPPSALPATTASVLRVRNKSDGPEHPSVRTDPQWHQSLAVCALNGDSIDELRRAVVNQVRSLGSIGQGAQVAIARQRHADGLQRAEQAVRAALAQLEPLAELALELVAADLRDAIDALDELTGPMTPDDVLAAIFSEFCIGK